MKNNITASLVAISALLLAAPAQADDTLRADIAADYEANLEALFTHFHQNPELSHREFETSKRLASEIRARAGL